MNSSTLDSEPLAPIDAKVARPRRRHASPRAAMAAFLVTCGILLTICLITKKKDLWPEHQPVATQARIPRSKDYYLAYYKGGVEHYMFYDGFAGIPKNLKEADVLIVGNSHTLFAFPRQTLEPFFQKRHLHYYQMSFGYGEASEFCEAVIRKYDLHPKWIIVGVDWFFGGLSPMSTKVLRETPFDGIKFRLETNGAMYGARYINTVVPLLDTNIPWDNVIYYRSRADGTIKLVTVPGGHIPLDHEMTLPVKAVYLTPWAPGFKAEMDRRGARMVFTKTPLTESRIVYEIADMLGGVPVVIPDKMPDLFTIDGSHLELNSAIRYSRAFLIKFAQLLDQPSTGKPAPAH